jgi:breast cancer 2 susceptibility protein
VKTKLDELERAGDDAGAVLASMPSLERLEVQAAREANEARRHTATEDAVRAALADQGLLERRVSRTVKLRVSGLRPRFNGGGGGGAGGGGGGGGGGGSRHAFGPTGAALLTAYDLGDEFIAQLEEGGIYQLTDLACRTNLAGLEVTAGRKTRWQQVSSAAAARAGLEAVPLARRLARAGDLGHGGGASMGDEFDAVAVLVHASVPGPAGAPKNQW